MRKRISITIRADLLHQVDSLVDKVHVRNRSHALETLLERTLTGGAPEVFILAGDEKVLLDINGPLLEKTLKTLKKQGFDRIVIGTTASLSQKLQSKFGDGADLGLKIRYLEQKERAGTAAALRMAKGHFSDTFLVIYGDNLFDFDLKDLINFHKSSGFAGTVALTSVKTPGKYGVVELQGRRIVGFDEKPATAESYIVSTGIFVFEPGVFNVVAQDAVNLEPDVLNNLIKIEKLGGYVIHGFWSSLDDEKAISAAKKELKD